MRRITFRIAVAILAFTIGIIGVWLVGLYPKIEDFLVDKLIPTPVLEQGAKKFNPLLRACGPGYHEKYGLPDGRVMWEGSACYETPRLAKKELQDRIDKSLKIIERVPNYKDRFGRIGERIVLLTLPDSYGARASILWYGGEDCFLYIDAPSLEIALEFERTNAYAH